MPSLLYETSGVDEVVPGFGRAGFAMGFGSDSPLHTWFTWNPGFLYVGAAMMSIGCMGRDAATAPWGTQINTGSVTITGIDQINQDQDNLNSGATFHFAGSGFNNSIGVGFSGAGTYITGSGSDYPIPFLLTGNAIKSFTGSYANGGLTYGSPVATVVGSQLVFTGIGFQPDVVIFIGQTSNGTETQSGGLRFAIGCMDSDGNQWTQSMMGIFESGPLIIGGVIGTNTRTSEFRTDSCILSLEDAYGSPGGNTQGRNRMSFSSMDPDGFTLNIEESNANFPAGYYIALKVDDPTKGFIKCNTHVQGDTVGETGLAIEPGCVFLCGDSWSASVDGAPPSTRAVLAVGGFDNTTNRSAFTGSISGASLPAAYYDDSAIMFGDMSLQTILGRAVGTIVSDGWQLAWTDDDGGARPFGSITFSVPNRGTPALNNLIPAELP